MSSRFLERNDTSSGFTKSVVEMISMVQLGSFSTLCHISLNNVLYSLRSSF